MRGALLNHINDFVAVQHGQMSVFAGLVNKTRQHRMRDLRYTMLARIGRSQLESLESDAVRALLGKAGDQSVTLQNLQQLVHRGARNAEFASERGGVRLTIARDELEDVERTVGRRSQRDTWRG